MMRAQKSGRTPGRSVADLGLPTRGFLPDEAESLRRRFRASGPRILRGIGLLFGLGALVLALTYFAGVEYDPNVIPWETLIIGFLSVGCTAGGASMVRDLRAALEAGQVVDQSGPLVGPTAAPGGLQEYSVGAVGFQAPASLDVGVAPGAAVRVGIALGPRPDAKHAVGVYPDRGLLVSFNEIVRDPPVMVHLRSVAPGPSDAVQSSPAFPPMPVFPVAAVASSSADGGAFCDRCGQANAVGFQFCRQCGARRTVVAAPPSGT